MLIYDGNIKENDGVFPFSKCSTIQKDFKKYSEKKKQFCILLF